MSQYRGASVSLFLQLVWILKHSQWQQPVGQVTASSVIRQLGAAHAQASAGAEWDLLTWARSYSNCNSPALPLVLSLSQPILEWANSSAADEYTQGQQGDAPRDDNDTLPYDGVFDLLPLPNLDALEQDEALLMDTDESGLQRQHEHWLNRELSQGSQREVTNLGLAQDPLKVHLLHHLQSSPFLFRPGNIVVGVQDAHADACLLITPSLNMNF